MAEIHLILASASPRRRELLGLLGYPFEVIVSGADEDAHLDAGPSDFVLHNARHKAETFARALDPGSGARRIVIAADSTVALDGAILGKPATPAEAREMLVALRGRPHDVHTAVCVVDPEDRDEATSVHTATVTMRDYSDGEITAYIATGDPFDKAAGYAIQHPTFRPVAALAGCYLGVMGLSLCDLIPLLRRMGVADSFDPAALVDAHYGFRHAVAG